MNNLETLHNNLCILTLCEYGLGFVAKPSFFRTSSIHEDLLFTSMICTCVCSTTSFFYCASPQLEHRSTSLTWIM